MKWDAKFDPDGNVTLTPDTPETRRELAQTWADMHSGNAKIGRAEWTKGEERR